MAEKSLSLKVLLTFAIIGMCLTYLILALHIFIDTEFSVPNISEAYSTFDWIELVDQSHKYLPYYGIYIFAFALFIFTLSTRYPEWLKVLCVVIPNCLIVLDIGSMWAIRYIHAGIFSWVLFFAGIFLALSFAIIALLTLYDLWIRRA
jgi:hypothetical protein